jgi:hypothetical protein
MVCVTLVTSPLSPSHTLPLFGVFFRRCLFKCHGSFMALSWAHPCRFIVHKKRSKRKTWLLWLSLLQGNLPMGGSGFLPGAGGNKKDDDAKKEQKKKR